MVAIVMTEEADRADDPATEDVDRLAVIALSRGGCSTSPELRDVVDALLARSARLEEVVKALLGAVHTLDQAMSRCSNDYCDSPVSGGLLISMQRLSEDVFGMNIPALAAQTAANGLAAY